MSYTKANKYNAFCFQCRKLAGMEPAGIPEDDLCEYHGREESTRIRAELDILQDRLSEMIIVKTMCHACSPDVKKAYEELDAENVALRERLKPVEEVYIKIQDVKALNTINIYKELTEMMVMAICKAMEGK